MTRRRILTIVGIVFGVGVVAVVGLALLGARVGNVYDSTVSYAPAAEGFAGGESDFAMATPAPTLTAPMPELAARGAEQGLAAPVPAPERLIIRTADLSLVVDDAETAIDQTSDMAVAMGGFVVNSNTYQSGEGALAGNVSFRVPAERFDEALDQLREMAVEVERESISGQDVTEEYVDLQARVESLKAAEERLQEIMENAQNTSDLLQAEQQLTMRQAEIESMEGRLQYLEQSAALSLVNVTFTPSVLSQPVDVTWKPLRTVRRSFDSLVDGLTGIVDAAIFLVIAVLPRLLLIALLLAPFYFVGRALWRRRQRRRGTQ